MTVEGPDERLIELDLRTDHVAAGGRHPLLRFVPAAVCLIIGVFIGFGMAKVYERVWPAAAPPPVMHVVVVTEDGRSQTFNMPSGSTVTTPAVVSSCSITIDGRFADFVSRVVGDAECGAVVP